MTMQQLRMAYENLCASGLKLDLTRGKPSPEQLDLSNELLNLPGSKQIFAEGKIDVRNYGGLQGLVEARKLFVGILGAPVERIVLANNASLALMHDLIVFALLRGVPDGSGPWSRQEPISFLCPVPGYDRHFKICEDYGIRMIPVSLGSDGPDMDEVERLVAADPSIKGIWCVPKYSNPTGTVYSDAVVERLCSMKTAAPDFRIFWDNAYAVHHLTEDRVEIANVLEVSAKHGNPNRPLVFASMSKITFAGASVSAVAASQANVNWILSCMTPQTIGPDKVNQLRHVLFLESAQGIDALMDKHRRLLAPKFNEVLEIFKTELTEIPEVSWTVPLGGYFICLTVPQGCATRVVELARGAGVALTPAGSTHPLGKDPDDRTIRIAPSFPALEEVREAAKVVTICVQLAAAEKAS